MRSTHSITSILLVDDHVEIRERFKTYIGQFPQFNVIAEAGDGIQAIEMADTFEPDCILIDIEMPKLDGLHAMQEILKHHPTTKIAVVSMHSNIEYVQQSLKLGAVGYVLKKNFHKEFLSMMEAMAHGHVYISPEIQID